MNTILGFFINPPSIFVITPLETPTAFASCTWVYFLSNLAYLSLLPIVDMLSTTFFAHNAAFGFDFSQFLENKNQLAIC